MARPSKYDSNYHPNSYVELSANGLTKSEICLEWNISRNTLNEWSKDIEKTEFQDAIKRGDTFREAYFCKLLKKIAIGEIRNANITAFIWLTKNTLKWPKEREEDQDAPPIVFNVKRIPN